MDNKYKDMSFEDFIVNVLGLELNETQKHLVKMYEELKGKENVAYPITNPYTPITPITKDISRWDKPIGNGILDNNTLYCGDIMGVNDTYSKTDCVMRKLV